MPIQIENINIHIKNSSKICLLGNAVPLLIRKHPFDAIVLVLYYIVYTN